MVPTGGRYTGIYTVEGIMERASCYRFGDQLDGSGPPTASMARNRYDLCRVALLQPLRIRRCCHRETGPARHPRSGLSFPLQRYGPPGTDARPLRGMDGLEATSMNKIAMLVSPAQRGCVGSVPCQNDSLASASRRGAICSQR